MSQSNQHERLSVKRELCLVVDVETAGGFGCPLVYDLGLLVIERRTGRVVEGHSLIIDEVFNGMPDAMATAYYAEKLPTYRMGIAAGAFEVVGIWRAWNIVKHLVTRYDIRRVYAYNAKFDRGALDNTFRVCTSRGRFFMPRSIRWCDIWHMACTTILSRASYRRFAHTHGMVSDAGNIRTSAEATYAYLTGSPEYAEPHTGLADCFIEAKILSAVIRTHKPLTENIVHNPWMIPNRKKVA